MESKNVWKGVFGALILAFVFLGLSSLSFAQMPPGSIPGVAPAGSITPNPINYTGYVQTTATTLPTIPVSGGLLQTVGGAPPPAGAPAVTSAPVTVGGFNFPTDPLSIGLYVVVGFFVYTTFIKRK